MKYLIRASWVVLACCFVIKLFGGNWFEIVCENEHFISACEYVDNTMWLKMTLACFISVIGDYLIICILLNKKSLFIKELVIFLPMMIGKSLLSWYNYWLSFSLNILVLIIVPFFINKDWKHILITNVLVIVFQLISMFIRNYNTIIFNKNLFVVQTIMQIDYYLMTFLYYLYTFRRKEE